MGHVDGISRLHKSKNDRTSSEEDQECAAIEECEDSEGPDSICRLISAVNFEEVTFQLQLTQGRDDKIMAIRNKLEIGPVEHFEMSDGLVYRVSEENRKLLYGPT